MTQLELIVEKKPVRYTKLSLDIDYTGAIPEMTANIVRPAFDSENKPLCDCEGCVMIREQRRILSMGFENGNVQLNAEGKRIL